MANITIVGAGTWGTAIAAILAKGGNNVRVLTLTGRNLIALKSGYHPNFEGILLPSSIRFGNDPEISLKDADFVIFAVSSGYLRATLDRLQHEIDKNQILISVIKGIEKKTLYVPTEIISSYFPSNHVAVLSGPSHAEEVIKGEPFGLQLASEDFCVVNPIRKIFDKCNVYLPATRDVAGVQLGAALKNIIAIGYGMALEQSLGTNFYSLLVTAAMSDLMKLAEAGGAKQETLIGLSGFGDLITTIGSPYSRNRKFGQLLGSGITVEQALEQVGMVVEGLNAMQGALELADRKEVKIPVIRFINDLIQQKYAPSEIKNLVQMLKNYY